MKPTHPTRQYIVTGLLILAFLMTCFVLVYNQYPQWFSPQNAATAPHATTNPTASASTSKALYADMWYLPIDPEAWGTQNESVNWNDVFTVTVRQVQHTKTLPNNTNLDEYVTGKTIVTDENGSLISDHRYIDVTAELVCIGTMPESPYSTKKQTFLNLALANQYMTVFDMSEASVLRSKEAAVTQILSNDHATDHHSTLKLSVGDTVTLRFIYIIDDAHWNDEDVAVLLTPQFGIYNATTIKQMGFQQPHIRLNED